MQPGNPCLPWYTGPRLQGVKMSTHLQRLYIILLVVNGTQCGVEIQLCRYVFKFYAMMRKPFCAIFFFGK